MAGVDVGGTLGLELRRRYTTGAARGCHTLQIHTFDPSRSHRCCPWPPCEVLRGESCVRGVSGRLTPQSALSILCSKFLIRSRAPLVDRRNGLWWRVPIVGAHTDLLPRTAWWGGSQSEHIRCDYAARSGRRRLHVVCTPGGVHSPAGVLCVFHQYDCAAPPAGMRTASGMVAYSRQHPLRDAWKAEGTRI